MMKISTKNSYWGVALVVLLFAFFVRFIGLMQTPPALYWEEVALGYDAYSILQTGKDHHGNPWPIVAFESFGDWKPSLYFYSLVPFIAIFDLQPWVVRVPSVLAGMSIVLAVGILSKKVAFLLSLENPNKYGLIGLFLASISTWAIHFSRGGWEVNLATGLLSWGAVFGLYGVDYATKQKVFKPVYILLSALLLVLSVYAYHGTRLVAPLIGVLLAWYWLSATSLKTFSLKQIWPIITSGCLAVLMIAPILLSLQSPQVSQRFAETSIFSTLEVIIESNQAKEALDNTFLSKILYHRYILFGREILTNYVDHFNLNFLFISGDSNPRHSTGYGGLLHYQEFIFLLVGIGVIIHKKQKSGLLLLAWWLVAIIPAALTKTTPHALRILPAMPAMLVITSLGLGVCFEYVVKVYHSKISILSKISTQNVTHMLTQKSYLFISIALVSVYIGTFTFWWRQYWLVYPKQSSSEWQYGYQQMVTEVEMRRGLQSGPVYITREQGRPAMYYWFYTKTDPVLVQAENATAKKDQSEFLTFQNISFPNTVHEISIQDDGAIVASSQAGLEHFQQKNMIIEDLVSVQNQLGKTIWNIYTVKP